MSQEPAKNQVLAISSEGAPVRRAIEVLSETGPALAGALRRAIPFLSKNGTPIKVTSVEALPLDQTTGQLAKPWHSMALVIEPGQSVGILALDGPAVAMVLDGLLGGDGKNPSPLKGSTLSTTQVALMTRVSTGLCTAFSEALTRIGLKVAPRPKNAPDSPGETAPITIKLQIGDGTNIGHVVLAIAKDALLAKSTPFAPPKKETPALDPRIANTVEQIEVELVAELGHTRMTLADLAMLQPGATLRLDAPLSGSVEVLAQGQAIFAGRPTAINGQIAVRLDRHEG
ncbi:MAG TPA: FliM/FliN family flagellar motor switch protein [Polyangiaceae bacterium]